ncbi:GNAT family N-acetyltransferase [Moraxella atlantae]
MKLKIRKYKKIYALDICKLFYYSINSIDPNIYTEKQKNAWCSTTPDKDKWHKRLKDNITWVALKDDKVVGFLELEDNGYINCLFVHPEFQANGIASKLYESMLLWVQKKNLKVIETDASEVAMPIFKKWGFNITEKKFIKRGAEILTNYNMRKNMETFARTNAQKFVKMI